MRLFERVVFVDWSAAASRGPRRPSPDRCWLAWGGAGERPEPRYCRTRHEAIDVVRSLLVGCRGDALVGFDFPYGFPHASGLGGGRTAAARLAAQIVDNPDGSNNRFEVAARSNAELNAGRAGPFWGCPARKACASLRATKPDFAKIGVPEFRIVEERLRRTRPGVQSVWKLYGAGSVGSQTLTGLPAIHRLLDDPALAARSRVWPFETGWDCDLTAIVHAEIWPTLRNSDAQRLPIKDARQVAELRDWALDEDARGALRRHFARPGGLSESEEKICRESEGWILGVE